MSNVEKLKKKLHNAFKLSGFLVRREFCSLITEKFIQEDISLDENTTFDTYIKNLCNSLEKQCLADKSIEREHIDQAIEVCLHAGCDKNETIFSIINAFDFPKFQYDPDRKLYFPARDKSKLLSGPNSKAQLFIDRYATILQRTQRNFKNIKVKNERDRPSLQTVDYLLTLSYARLKQTIILGSLLQVSEGQYYLEDPSGIVQLDLADAEYEAGFFAENSFVLVDGYYEDKILYVKKVTLPPAEEYKDSRAMFGNMNYFGGLSGTPLRDSRNLQEYLHRNPQNSILFFSDVWLDHPMIFEKLEVLFDGMENSLPPLAFVFLGNFMEELQGLEKMDTLKKLFKQFGELVSHYPGLMNNSQFVFVPGMSDPSTPHIVPRFPLPSHITEEFRKSVPKAIFATNPCRLQYCNKEVALFRADVLVKLMQGTMSKPKKEKLKKDTISEPEKELMQGTISEPEKELMQGTISEPEKELMQGTSESEKELMQGTMPESEKELMQGTSESEKELMQGTMPESEKELMQGTSESEKELMQGTMPESEKELMQGTSESEKELMQGTMPESEKELMQGTSESEKELMQGTMPEPEKELMQGTSESEKKLMEDTMPKSKKDVIAEHAMQTIISQGHLSPLPVNALTVHWDFDYTLRLYPLPNLIVLGDKSEAYKGKYKGCQVVNPGSFCDNGFQFTCYTPFKDLLDDCAL